MEGNKRRQSLKGKMMETLLISPSVSSLTVTLRFHHHLLLESLQVLRPSAASLLDCTIMNINAGAKTWQKRVEGRWMLLCEVVSDTHCRISQLVDDFSPSSQSIQRSESPTGAVFW